MALIELSDANRDTSLQFKMEGPVFEDGIPIPIMVESLTHIQGILDKSYLGLIDRRRMSREERLKFYLRAQRVERGSLFADLGVIYTGAQTVLPIFGVLGSNGIWEYAKSAFSLIKFVFSAVKKGQAVTYNFTANRSVLHVNTGTQENSYNAPVFNIASLSIGHYQGLAQTLDLSRVIDIRLGEGEARDIGIALPDRDLFNFPSRVEDQAHKIECELYEFDKFDKDGRLHVGLGQTIPEGDYRFDVIGKTPLSTSQQCSRGAFGLRVIVRSQRTRFQARKSFAFRSSALKPNSFLRTSPPDD
jgi:hypothetical protein